jgi:hypothetical protein
VRSSLQKLYTHASLVMILEHVLLASSAVLDSVETGLLTTKADGSAATVTFEEARSEPGEGHQEEDHAEDKSAFKELGVGSRIAHRLGEGQPGVVAANTASTSPLAIAVDDRALGIAA